MHTFIRKKFFFLPSDKAYTLYPLTFFKKNFFLASAKFTCWRINFFKNFSKFKKLYFYLWLIHICTANHIYCIHEVILISFVKNILILYIFYIF